MNAIEMHAAIKALQAKEIKHDKDLVEIKAEVAKIKEVRINE